MFQDPLRSGALLLALSGAVLVVPGASSAEDFVRGDVDSSGRPEVTDAVIILRALFAGELDRIACEDAADVDDGGSLAVTDAVSLLEALFRGGSPPAAPFPACGSDPTEDALRCEAHEACRTTLTFFGVPVSADGVIFVVDKSPPLSWNGGLTRIKEEMIRVIDALPEKTGFAMVFFAANFNRFPFEMKILATADPTTKESARAFVDAMVGGQGTCPKQGLLLGVQYLDMSTVSDPVVLHVTDGGGTCMGGDEAQYLQSTVEEVTEANAGRARILTFGLEVLSPAARQHLEDLAARNGGAFTEVP